MHRFRVTTLIGLFFVYVIAGSASLTAQNGGDPKAKNLKNPVQAAPQSIEAGKAIYTKSCVFCHGATGKADTPLAAKTKGPKPSVLSDGNWDNGSTDGEIFVSIRDGVGTKTAMKPYKGKIPDQDIWHVVNFIRSLGTAK